MDELFGTSLNSIMAALLVLLAGILAVAAWLAFRRGIVVKIGLRNIPRRKAQTTLIIIGLMLSTLIISAAFAMGDTIAYSTTNLAYNTLEEVDFILGYDAQDEIVSSDQEYLTDEFLALMRARFGEDPDIDGISGVLLENLPVVNPSTRLSEPQAGVAGVDATVDSFKGLRSLDDEPISAGSLTAQNTFVSEKLANAIGARAGDTLNLYVDNEPHPFTVAGVVRDSSLTGAAGEDLTVGGMVISLEALRGLTGRQGRLSNVVISVRGGTRDSLELTDAVEPRIEAFLDQNPASHAQIEITKAEFVEFAQIFGSFFVTFFLIFGLFSIAAGVMLIFLIFVMLAAERRSEMGISRAVGMSRMHLTESFLAEGLAYNLGAAAVGAVLGLGVASLLIIILRRIFDDFGFSIEFHLNPRAFVIAYGLGVTLTFATTVIAAYRAANMNIVSAIRDLPDTPALQGHDRSLRGILLAMVGVLWTLAWIGLVGAWVILGAILFFIGLGTFGIGLVIGAIAISLFIAGARIAAGSERIRGKRLALYIVWWLVFTLAALVTFVLLKTQRWASRHRNAGGWAAWLLLLGLLLIYLGGWVWEQEFAYTSGTTFAVLAIAMLAVYFGAASRVAFTVGGLALVWYWLLPLPFSLFGSGTEIDPIDGLFRVLQLPRPGDPSGDLEMFFVSGVLMTLSATLVIIFNSDAILGLVSRLGPLTGGMTPALKMAVAYPLAAKFRTGMTLVMFGLVVFSLVVMATLNFNFSQFFFSEEAKAGFDVRVTPNELNRVGDLRGALVEAGYSGTDLGGVGGILVASEDAQVHEGAAAATAGEYTVLGVDDEFLQLAQLPLRSRANGFESDAAVIQALRSDPAVAIIDDSALRATEEFEEESSDEPFRFANPALFDGPWDPVSVTVTDPATGNSLELKVIGVIEPQVTELMLELGGIYTARANVERTFGDADSDLFLATVAGDRSADASTALAASIESTLLERGVQADSIDELIDEQAGISSGFQLLFEGFMGLGLIVGVAALGVIAFRTVVERRQQVGMLRAIGYTRRLIAFSFFFESSFIALTGILMGLVLGTALSYNLLTSPEFTDGATIDFQVPWVRLLVIGGIAYIASALMTLIPARSASRISVAEALRAE